MIASGGVESSVVVIGAGPAGIDVALRLRRVGIPVTLLERGDLAATIRDWPLGTKMFSPQERVAVANLPFPPELADREHLTREQYLRYLGDAVRGSGLSVLTCHEAVSIQQDRLGFGIEVRQRGDASRSKHLRCRYLVFATGCMHAPLLLGVPGEDLPFVRYLPGFGFDTLKPRSACVIGGRHSAVEACLRLVEGGSAVTLIYRRRQLLRAAIKSWLYDEAMRRIEEGSIRLLGSTEVTEFGPGGQVRLQSRVDGTRADLHCDLALVACGFTHDASLLRSAGVDVYECRPRLDASTLESNVRNAFVVGTAIAGQQQSGYKHDIDNVSGHGAIVTDEILRRLKSRDWSETRTSQGV